MENMATEAAVSHEIPEELKEALLTSLGDLTMLPAVASQAIALTNDVNCSAADFSQVVERDIALAAQILSVSNCAIFSGGTPISSLRQAVVRLGFRKCRNLIISCSTACMVKSMNLSDEWIREVLWEHSFATATTATALNRSLNLGFDGEEFSAGLMHDFGRLLIAVATAENFSSVDLLEFNESDCLLTLEDDRIGTNHCQFGAWFATEAGIPEALVEVIRCHHRTGSLESNSLLVSLTIAADHLANHLQRKELVSEYVAAENPGLVQLSERTGTDCVAAFQSEAESIFEEAQAPLQMF